MPSYKHNSVYRFAASVPFYRSTVYYGPHSSCNFCILQTHPYWQQGHQPDTEVLCTYQLQHSTWDLPDFYVFSPQAHAHFVTITGAGLKVYIYCDKNLLYRTCSVLNMHGKYVHIMVHAPHMVTDLDHGLRVLHMLTALMCYYTFVQVHGKMNV